MMWEEFEKIAGYEVSYEDYHNIIEPMYMAIPEGISKAEFVKMINKKYFALPDPKAILNEMRKYANRLQMICGLSSDYESEKQLQILAYEYAQRKYGIDWAHDSKAYIFFLKGYEYPEVKRGCTYPKTLVIGRGDIEYERTELVK